MSTIDTSNITFQYDDKCYQLVERQDNDLTSVFTGWCSNTGGARDLMKGVEKLVEIAGKSCGEIGAYLHATSIPRAPVVLIEAKHKVTELYHKGAAALGTYRVAKTCSAVLEAAVMTGFATICLGKLSSLGNFFKGVKTLDLAYNGIEAGTWTTDVQYFGRMYAGAQVDSPENEAIVKQTINTEWLSAALKVAKIAAALVGGVAYVYAEILFPGHAIVSKAALFALASLEIVMSISSYYTKNLGDYSIKQVNINVA